jgi:hypothetical protein
MISIVRLPCMSETHAWFCSCSSFFRGDVFGDLCSVHISDMLWYRTTRDRESSQVSPLVLPPLSAIDLPTRCAIRPLLHLHACLPRMEDSVLYQPILPRVSQATRKFCSAFIRCFTTAFGCLYSI